MPVVVTPRYNIATPAPLEWCSGTESLIVASDGTSNDNFALGFTQEGGNEGQVLQTKDQTTLFVGVYNWDGAVNNQGRIYVYEKQGGVWVEIQMIENPFPNFGQMGYSMATSFTGEHLLVGNAINVHYFQKVTGTWIYRSTFAPGKTDTDWVQEVQSHSPLVWLRLDESSGVSAADSSGNGRNGNLLEPFFWTNELASPQGGAINGGNGSLTTTSKNAVIQVLNTGSWIPSTGWSASIWIKTTNGFNHAFGDPIMGSWQITDTTRQHFSVGITGTQQVRFDIRNGSGTQVFIGGAVGPLINNGQWHHVMVTLGLNKGMTLYIDGEEIAGNPVETTTRVVQSDTAFTVAEYADFSTSFGFQGSVDEPMMFPTELTPNDAKQLYTIGNWSSPSSDNFGASMTMNDAGDVALVGAYAYDQTGDRGQAATRNNAGRLYSFTRSGTIWSEEARIDPPTNPHTDGRFGGNMAMETATTSHFVVGQPEQTSGGGAGPGEAHAYVRNPGAVNYRYVVLAKQPVVYYTFDQQEVGSAILFDEIDELSPSALLVGTPVFEHPPVIGSGKSMSLNGTSQYTIGALTNFDYAQSFTWECWMRTTATPTTAERLINNRGAGAAGTLTGVQVSFNTGDWGNTLVDDGAGNWAGFTNFNGVPYAENDGNPHHIVVTWDTTTGTLELFIDGVSQVSDTNAALIGTDFFSGSAFRIGATTISASQHYDGAVDEVAIYQRVLTGPEILANYNAGIASREPWEHIEQVPAPSVSQGNGSRFGRGGFGITDDGNTVAIPSGGLHLNGVGPPNFVGGVFIYTRATNTNALDITTLDGTATYSNNNRTITAVSGSYPWSYLTPDGGVYFKNSGKWYWETVIDTLPTVSEVVVVGLTSSPVLGSGYIGANASTFGVYNTGNVWRNGANQGALAIGSYTQGTVIRHKLDMDNFTYEVAYGGGVFENVDPFITPPFDLTSGASWAPAIGVSTIGGISQVTGNFAAADMAFSVPAGFRAIAQPTWTEQQVIQPPDAQGSDFFGDGMPGAQFSTDGATLVVGAWGQESPGIDRKGAAYVYETTPGDTSFNSVVFQTNCNGPDGATALNDESNDARTITFNGATLSNTQSESCNATAIQFVKASSQYIQLADNAAFDIASNEYTIEYSVFLSTLPTTVTYTTIDKRNDGAQFGWGSSVDTALKVRFFGWASGGATPVINMTSTTVLSVGVWYKVRIVRDSGGTWHLYVDGVREQMLAETAPIGANSSPVRFGLSNNTTNGGRPLDGFIDNIRITNGVARSTGAFYVVETNEFIKSLADQYVQAARIVPSSTDTSQEFGRTISLRSNSELLVGAGERNSPSAGQGAIYVYNI